MTVNHAHEGGAISDGKLTRPHAFILRYLERDDGKFISGSHVSQKLSGNGVPQQCTGERVAGQLLTTEPVSNGKLEEKETRAQYNLEIGKLIASDSAVGRSKEETSESVAILDMLLDMSRDKEPEVRTDLTAGMLTYVAVDTEYQLER